MAESGNPQKRRKKSKYFAGSKKRKNEDKLSVGMRGILVFGAIHENLAKREVYNVLNEYADELFGSEFLESVLHWDVGKKLTVDYQHGDEKKIIVENNKESESSEEDIEKEIAKEVDQIKNVKKERRFQGVSTGVHGIIFIKSTLSNDNLNKLVHYILSDLEKTKEKKSRNFQRLIPVTEICRANIESIHKTVSEKFLPEFSGHDKAPIKFCIHYKSRFNEKLTRNQVLSEIAAVFLGAGHTVDLKSPDKVVVVEVMKGLCCMNVVKDFFKFKKYNVHEITNNPKDYSRQRSEQQDVNYRIPEEELESRSRENEDDC